MPRVAQRILELEAMPAKYADLYDFLRDNTNIPLSQIYDMTVEQLQCNVIRRCGETIKDPKCW